MSRATGIEWTDATWNPIRGCSRVSEGCRHCYAETVANRFCGPGKPYEGLVRIGADGKGTGQWNGQIRFIEKRLLDPLRWREPQKIFVNSMSDLFHENVTDEMLDRIFAVMALCPQHTFQVLTKRPERMLKYLRQGDREQRVAKACVRSGQPIGPGYFSMAPGGGDLWEVFGKPGKLRFVDERVDGGALCSHADWCAADFVWPPNVWLGVSVENQKAADERIPLLLQTPAAVRFLSVEPLMGPVDLRELASFYEGSARPLLRLDAFTGEHECGGQAFGPSWGSLDWVIVGGESGPGARPMHPDWARSLRDQCKAAGVPFFFKQWGEWASQFRVNACPEMSHWMHVDGRIVTENAAMAAGETWTGIARVGKKAAGHLLDGEVIQQFPEVRA